MTDKGKANNDASDTIGAMAAGVAHEFNNILAGILASAEDTLDGARDPEVKRSLRLIIREVEKACLITDKLLYFSGQGHLDRTSIELAGLLDGALALMEPFLRDYRIAVTRHFDKVDAVSIDGPRMEQVFLNLLRNAAESMPQGGRLTVVLSSELSHALVRITDTGSGMASEVLARAFEPFFTTRGVFAGGDGVSQGLGLSVSRGIVLMHGGTIELESVLEQGTTVTVRLPLGGEQEPGDE